MPVYRCIAHVDKTTYFPSKSSPSTKHEVKWDPKKEVLWCTCASWRFHHHENLGCKHVDHVMENMCGWDGRIDGTPVAHKLKDGTPVPEGAVPNSHPCCPFCGGAVEEIA